MKFLPAFIHFPVEWENQIKLKRITVYFDGAE